MQERMYLGEQSKQFLLLVNMFDVTGEGAAVIDVNDVASYVFTK